MRTGIYFDLTRVNFDFSQRCSLIFYLNENDSCPCIIQKTFNAVKSFDSQWQHNWIKDPSHNSRNHILSLLHRRLQLNRMIDFASFDHNGSPHSNTENIARHVHNQSLRQTEFLKNFPLFFQNIHPILRDFLNTPTYNLHLEIWIFLLTKWL